MISNLGIIKGINHNENKVRCVSQLFRKGCVLQEMSFFDIFTILNKNGKI